MSTDFATRLAALQARIASVTDRPVQIVAVSKGHPIDACRAAAAAGVVDLGENYAQELVAKAEELAGETPSVADLRWHFIGGLQRNKVRALAPHVHLWHTVDRQAVADEIAKRSPGARVLIQVDLARTEGRAGCPPEDVEQAVTGARAAGLDVRGLMGVAPIGPPDTAREAFRRLADSARALSLPELSMGMSGDLEIALEEGATIVRIGTDLFGPRQRKN